MAPPTIQEPVGLFYRPELISAGEEARLLEEIEDLRFDPVVLHGVAARRTARHFGLDYDYGARAPRPGELMPGWLGPVRERAAELAGSAADELVEILVQRYPAGSTIGWHVDAPAFGVVVGVSLLGSARLRLRRGPARERRVWELALAPRSGYVLTGEARTEWQHAIPATTELRYSVTFRSLRQPVR